MKTRKHTGISWSLSKAQHPILGHMSAPTKMYLRVIKAPWTHNLQTVLSLRIQFTSQKCVNVFKSGSNTLLRNHTSPIIYLHFRYSSITRELPDNVPFATIVGLITDFQTDWKDYTENCFRRVKDHTLEILTKCVDVRFRRYAILHNQVR